MDHLPSEPHAQRSGACDSVVGSSSVLFLPSPASISSPNIRRTSSTFCRTSWYSCVLSCISFTVVTGAWRAWISTSSGERGRTMTHDTPAYGLWALVIINTAVFVMFAFSFTHPRRHATGGHLVRSQAFSWRCLPRCMAFPSPFTCWRSPIPWRNLMMHTLDMPPRPRRSSCGGTERGRGRLEGGGDPQLTEIYDRRFL